MENPEYKCQPQASHFIDGDYIEDSAGEVIEVIYPATGEVVARVHEATPAICEKAIVSANAAQKIWAAMSGAERGRILRRASDLMRDKNRELSILETYDTGKPLQETLVADAASGADSLEYFGTLVASMTGEHIELADGDFAYTKRQPLGICLGIGAWNYPIQIASWKSAPALCCGNAMIFKPSEITPLSALKLAEIFIEAGAPKGLFNVVQGKGSIGAALLNDPRIAKVSLTGSVPTGQKVYEMAAQNFKHATLELGGKSPLIIFEDANIDDAVSGAILANFYSTGQICSNGTRVFVHANIKEKFLTEMVKRLSGVKIGDPLDETTNFGPMVSQRQLDIVMDYIKSGIAEGANLYHGGKVIEGEGYYMEPTIFTNVKDDMKIAREEIFGPVMSVFDFDNEADVVARANETSFGLAAGIFTQDIKRAYRVIEQLEAGTCWINTYNYTPVEMPFGGVKNSGMGRENSRAALEYYSQIKATYVSMNAVEAPF
jgi:betaine-aldehyde dehydrogenase